MAIRNEPPPKLHYPELSTIILERMFKDRHKFAGDLDPKQHVFTIDTVVELIKLFSMHTGKKVMDSPATRKNKRDSISRMFKDLLQPAADNYKSLNRTQ